MTDAASRPSDTEAIDGQRPAEAARTLQDRSPHEIRQLLGQMPPAEAASVAAHLPEAARAGDDDPAGLDAAALELDQSIEDLVQPAPAALSAEDTVAQTLAFLVRSELIDQITDIYVVDQGRLLGVVGMRDIVLARPGDTLGAIMTADPVTFERDTDIGDAVREVLARHANVYPVVDAMGRLLGIVEAWQLFERVVIEISGQAGAQVGVSREENVRTGVFEAFRLRHPWLQVNLLTAFAAAVVVGLFEDTITRIVALAAFLPVLAGQSGNTGCQALAITLRGMTLGQLDDYPIPRILRKEILLGALNGLAVGVVAGLAMYAYAAMSGEANPVMLGVVILVAMIGACIGSGIFGVVVPVTLKRLGADPAMASSIFLTTFTDIIGMGLMLFLASMLLL